MATASTKPLKIIVADKNPIFREGLCSILTQNIDAGFIRQVNNGQELCEKIDKLSPDIIMTDLHLPVNNGMGIMQMVSKYHPHLGVIGISVFDQSHLIREFIRAGGQGYFSRNAAVSEIVTAVKTVYQGQNYFSNAAINIMLRSFAGFNSKHPDSKPPNFTTRELEVIRLICQQYSNKEIADKMKTTIRAVESARERIQNKTGARNMVGVAMYAVRTGIILFHELREFA